MCTVKSTIPVWVAYFLTCAIVAHVDGDTITIGLLVPHTGARSIGEEAETTTDLALQKVGVG